MLADKYRKGNEGLKEEENVVPQNRDICPVFLKRGNHCRELRDASKISRKLISQQFHYMALKANTVAKVMFCCIFLATHSTIVRSGLVTDRLFCFMQRQSLI